MRIPAALAASLLVCLVVFPSWASTPVRAFADVPSYLRSLPNSETGEADGVWGELSVKGQNDWAGVVFSHEDLTRFRQIVVLSKGSDGKYRVITDTEREEATTGGTGRHFIDGISIGKRSLFVTSSWNWHGCAGNASHQYRLDKGQWRLIGANFRRHNALQGLDGETNDIKDEATIDVNLLTRNVEVLFTPHLKEPQLIRAKIKQEKALLKDYHDDQGMPEGLSSYADC